jgi:hypothetical protein
MNPDVAGIRNRRSRSLLRSKLDVLAVSVHRSIPRALSDGVLNRNPLVQGQAELDDPKKEKKHDRGQEGEFNEVLPPLTVDSWMRRTHRLTLHGQNGGAEPRPAPPFSIRL